MWIVVAVSCESCDIHRAEIFDHAPTEEEIAEVQGKGCCMRIFTAEAPVGQLVELDER